MLCSSKCALAVPRPCHAVLACAVKIGSFRMACSEMAATWASVVPIWASDTTFSTFSTYQDMSSAQGLTEANTKGTWQHWSRASLHKVLDKCWPSQGITNLKKSKAQGMSRRSKCSPNISEPLSLQLASEELRLALMNSSRISIPLLERASIIAECWCRSLPHVHAMLEISWAPDLSGAQLHSFAQLKALGN